MKELKYYFTKAVKEIPGKRTFEIQKLRTRARKL